MYWPPRTWHAGIPKALPAMSTSAVSIALRAKVAEAPQPVPVGRLVEPLPDPPELDGVLALHPRRDPPLDEFLDREGGLPVLAPDAGLAPPVDALVRVDPHDELVTGVTSYVGLAFIAVVLRVEDYRLHFCDLHRDGGLADPVYIPTSSRTRIPAQYLNSRTRQ